MLTAGDLKEVIKDVSDDTPIEIQIHVRTRGQKVGGAYICHENIETFLDKNRSGKFIIREK